MGHDGIPPKRKFRLEWKDRSKGWVLEKDCRNCFDLVAAYVQKKKILPLTIARASRVGFKDGNKVHENWVPMSEVVRKAIQYGDPNTIQPQLFKALDPRNDGLFAVQIGTHAYGLLHPCLQNTCIISDGLNSYQDDLVAQEFVESHCAGKQIMLIPFFGQNQDNRCGSSAAAILIELQKVYKAQRNSKELRPETVTLARIRMG